MKPIVYAPIANGWHNLKDRDGDDMDVLHLVLNDRKQCNKFVRVAQAEKHSPGGHICLLCLDKQDRLRRAGKLAAFGLR